MMGSLPESGHLRLSPIMLMMHTVSTKRYMAMQIKDDRQITYGHMTP